MGRYVPNQAGFNRLATSQRMRKIMKKLGESGAEFVRGIAPRGQGPGAGDYADSVTARTYIALVGKKKLPRAAVRIAVSVPYAKYHETGAKRIPHPTRPLTRLKDILDAADPNLKRGRKAGG